MSALALAALAAAVAPAPRGEPTPPSGSPEIEVRLLDDSSLKVRLLDEKLELHTKHGTLHIAAADVRRIEFATRMPPGDADKIAAALSGLESSVFKTRERAAADLKGFRARAYPAVVKAAEHSDPEVAARAKAILADIKGKVPAGLLESRDADVVHTDDSKITGRLSAVTLRVQTFPFGEQRLRLADVRSLGAPDPVDDSANALPAPPSLFGYANQFGKELVFKIYGGPAAIPGAPGAIAAQGGLWGTDQYTLDSSLWAAAVHAGVVQPGQTATVKVRIIQSPAAFGGSVRNGIQSAPYGVYPGGAFEFVKK